MHTVWVAQKIQGHWYTFIEAIFFTLAIQVLAEIYVHMENSLTFLKKFTTKNITFKSSAVATFTNKLIISIRFLQP